jgi:hypothetical protein
MSRHRSHSVEFKRQVVAEYHAGETLHGLARRHDLSRRGALTDEDRIDGSLHVVVDTPRAGPTEEGKRLVMGVKDHLLRLARIGPHEWHPAVAEADMGDLHRHRRAIEDHHLMAPVELVGLARIEAQRNIGAGRRFLRRLRPVRSVAPHGIIAAAIAAVAQLFVDPDQRQALPLRPSGILGQHLVQLRPPGIDLRPGLRRVVVGELGRARADDLAHRIARCGSACKIGSDSMLMHLDWQMLRFPMEEQHHVETREQGHDRAFGIGDRSR